MAYYQPYYVILLLVGNCYRSQIKEASINLSQKKIKSKVSKCSYLHTRVTEAAAAVMQRRLASPYGM